MNTEKKIIDLLFEGGLSGKFLKKLNESEINLLYKKLNEVTITKVQSAPETIARDFNPGEAVQIDVGNEKLVVTKDRNNTYKFSTQKESEMIESSDIEMTEKFESKAQQKYFWAKCNKSKGKEKAKWCKMAEEFSEKTSKKDYKKMPEKINPEKTVKYKKETKEGYMDMIGKATNKNMLNKIGDIRPGIKYESDLEKRIGQIIEKNLNPRMSKKDLIKLVSETELAPEKERTKEREKTRTPSKPKHDNPYKPKPGVKPAPKAGRNELPNWLTFDSMGINIK